MKSILLLLKSKSLLDLSLLCSALLILNPIQLLAVDFVTVFLIVLMYRYQIVEVKWVQYKAEIKPECV